MSVLVNDMGKTVIYVLAFLTGVFPMPNMQNCDKGKTENLQEGNLGQDGAFPWLGALRVHLHEGATLKIAVTGIVLIRDKYALANAHDVVRIPRDVFKDDSVAMFIGDRDKPWSTPLDDYVAHPEYDVETLNTIAVVELRIGMDVFNPIKPICWPKYSFNTSNHLYVIGYTDENQLLEKELHKMQFVQERYCDEFYSRAKLKEDKIHPFHVQCAFAEKLKKDCVWETGQVMASNSSGTWTLIGLGVHGPGCAAPARFISVMPYLPWVEVVTDLDHISGYRRSAFGTGFRRRPKPIVKEEPPYVPIHETFLRQDADGTADDNASSDASADAVPTPPTTILHPYQIHWEDPELYKIDRVDVDEINIVVFDNMYESTQDACRQLKTLVYNDETKIVTNHIYASAVYKLSLHDINVMGFSCINIKVDSTTRERAKLWWKKSIEKYEPTIFEDMGYLPKQLFKILPVRPIMLPTPAPSKEEFKPKDKDHLEAMPMLDERDYESRMENINLLIRLTFRYNATLKVTIYGPPFPPPGRTTTVAPPEETTTAGSTTQGRRGIDLSYTDTTEAEIEAATTTEVSTTESTTTHANLEVTSTDVSTTELSNILVEVSTTDASTTEATTEINTPKSFRRILFLPYLISDKDHGYETNPYQREHTSHNSIPNYPYIPRGRPSIHDDYSLSLLQKPYSFKRLRPIKLQLPDQRSKTRQEKAFLREVERRLLARKHGMR